MSVLRVVTDGLRDVCNESVNRADVDGEFVATTVNFESCDGKVDTDAVGDKVAASTLGVLEVVENVLAVEVFVAWDAVVRILSVSTAVDLVVTLPIPVTVED